MMPNNILAPTRRTLLRWSGRFTLGIILLISVINLAYLQNFFWPDDTLARFAIPIIYIGQATLLAGIPWLLIVLPLTLLLPFKRLIVPLCILLAAASMATLIVDVLLFSSNQFHLSPMVLQILDWQTWGFGGFYFALLLIVLSIFSGWLWKHLSKRFLSNSLIAILFCCVLTAQGLYAWADANYYVPVTSFSRHMPLSVSLTAKRFFNKYGMVDLKQARARKLASSLGAKASGRLRYPLKEIELRTDWDSKNILIILIDAMRYDMLADNTAPAIKAFADQNISFGNHYSGGNSSRPGFFSIFYGLPGTYWSEFETSQRAPVLMDTFQQRNYQLGIFSSFDLFRIDADRTTFANIASVLPTSLDQKDPAYVRDIEVSRRWRNWLDNRDATQPFFGLVYLASVHSRAAPPDALEHFIPPEGASKQQKDFAKYQNAMRWTDGITKEILDDLAARDLMDSTVVLVTADHGQEFNENGLGYTGHGTSFSRYQLHVPLIMHWPGSSPSLINRRTSHLDIVPTLMTDLLGTQNSVEDYGFGNNLFMESQWPYLIAGSYNEIALIQPDRITTSQGAYFEVRDAETYRLLEAPELRTELMKQALSDTTRFLR